MLGPLLFRDDLDLQEPAAAHMTQALFLGGVSADARTKKKQKKA